MEPNSAPSQEVSLPRRNGRRWVRVAATAAGVAVAVVVLSLGAWVGAPSPGKCVTCHELQASADTWAISAHRDVSCESCHGGTFTSGLHGLQEHTRRLAGHVAGPPRSGTLGLSEDQIVRMMERCEGCHAAEYAGWEAGRHDVRYGTVLLNVAENTFQPPNEDCLRCHGMYYEGEIGDLVAPTAVDGEFVMLSEEHVERPAIPCMACHQVHSDFRVPADVPSPGLGMYDRNEGMFFPSSLLPVPPLKVGDLPVVVSPHMSQRLCMQCHAASAGHQAGTADDRTPRGVHEGIACVQCHHPHRQETAPSCAGCHPGLSNCGLPVETMDTTFRSLDSRHNIHFVSCLDCHPGGAPEGRD